MLCVGLLCATLLHAGEGATQAPAWTLYPSFGIASDYRFNGVSISDRRPSLQASLHWIGPGRFYLGVWLAQVDFNDPGDTSLEVDVYAGRQIVRERTQLRFEVMVNSFDDQVPGPTYDFLQLKLRADRRLGRLWVGSSTAFTPEGSYGSGITWQVRGHLSYPFSKRLSMSAQIGRGMVERRHDRWYWDLGVTADWRRLSLDIRWTDTSLSVEECGGTRWCVGALVAALTVRGY